MLWWDSVAPFGKPVVPLVYWMLIGSSNCSSADRASSAAWSTAVPDATSWSHSDVPRKTTRSSAWTVGRTSATIAT
jgi:hypothetical protein